MRGDLRTVRSACIHVLVALLLGASAPAALAQSEPAFSYAAYCDAQGRFTYDGAAQALVQRPSHLRRVYEDAARGDARAREVIRELEEVFHGFGSWVAEQTTRPECLGLPELTPGCLPRLEFLDELLGNSPEAARLRDVVAQAYEVRARQRGARNAVILSVVDLLLAHGLAQGVLGKALTQEVRTAKGATPSPRPAPDFVVTPRGTAYPVPPGSKGPTPVTNPAGKTTGTAFTGGRGGANSQVDTIRLMNPTPPRGRSPGYPNGYIKYENASGQGVDPYTGKTGTHAETHFPIDQAPP